MATKKGPPPMSALMIPKPALLCKLGSIAVHAKEFLGPNGHAFDRAALEALLDDDDVRRWLREMDTHALIPRTR